MPYSIVTRDGIHLNNIPDDVPQDDPRLKQLVAQKRAMRQGGGQQPQQPQFNGPSWQNPAVLAQYAQKNPSEYDPSSEAYGAKYSAPSGMSGPQKFFGNLGAGIRGSRHRCLNVFNNSVSSRDVFLPIMHRGPNAEDATVCQGGRSSASQTWVGITERNAMDFRVELACRVDIRRYDLQVMNAHEFSMPWVAAVPLGGRID